MPTCQDKPFFSSAFKYARHRAGKAIYRWGCVNLPNFMCEMGFRDSLSLASLAHCHAPWQPRLPRAHSGQDGPRDLAPADAQAGDENV